MTTSELTLPQVRKEPRRPRRVMGAGKQLHAGPVTYIVLTVFALVSLAPLVWTAVAASRTDRRLAETPPPLWFGGTPAHSTFALFLYTAPGRLHMVVVHVRRVRKAFKAM